MQINPAIYKYLNVFSKPFNSGRDLLKEKPGIILSLTDEKGNYSLSEISFLKNFTKKNESELIREYKKFKDFIRAVIIPDDYPEFNIFLTDLFEKLKLSSQMRFAIDMGFLNLFEKRTGLNAADLLELCGIEVNSAYRIPVCRLIVPAIDQKISLQMIEKSINEGFNTFKLKTGRLKLQQERRFLVSVFDRFAGRIRIRTDSNSLMTLERSLELFHGFNRDFIEYAEDPVLNTDDYSGFSDITGIPTAIDLDENELTSIEDIHYKNCVLVVKPPRAGSIKELSRLYSLCLDKGIPLVFSSLFESGIGILNIGKTAGLFGKMKLAAGIDTLSFFNKDILLDPVKFESGFLYPDSYLKRMKEMSSVFLEDSLTEIV